ncbi:MAG: YihY/virulence factor BrkB family protein [Bacteroidales bacterium]|jgi:membrane protein|nr:YihY/virulence factor BrkB family protein [Bacteroidales bacterium]
MKTKTQYIRKLIYFRPVRTAMHFLRNVTMPGLQGVPCFFVARFFVTGLYRSSLNQRSAATAFHFVLALFPLVLFFFTLLPYIPVSKLYVQLYELLNDLLPESVYVQATEVLDDIIKRKHTGLMSIGFITSMYVASSGINAVLISFNQSKQIKQSEKRKWLNRRLLSLILILLIGFVMIFAFCLIVGFKSFTSYLLSHNYLAYGFHLFLLRTIKWILLVGLIYFIFAAIYYIAPIRKKGYRFVSAGSTMATLLLILTTQGFSFYIRNFSHYNVLYGSIGTLIVLMIWIYLNCFILLVGFELNAAIVEARGSDIYSHKTKRSSRGLRKRMGIRRI